MAEPVISVIIPAYNVEGWLPRALDSLLKQTFGDFEAIVVDDGSTDGTAAVCDAYARADGRVFALHQQNAGAPAARNSAIARARGKYLYFMDADDWAEPGMLEEMLRLAESTGAEMVISGFYIDTEYNRARPFRQICAADDAFYPDAQSFRRAATGLFDRNLLYTPWNKLVLARRVRERHILFRSTKMDDFPFNLDYIRDVERVAVSSIPFYHFIRARTDSETARYFPRIFEKREEEHGWMLEMYQYWGMSEEPEVKEFLARRYIERMFGVIENLTCAACPLSRGQKQAELTRYLESPHVAWSLRYAQPRSIMMRLMLIPLRLRSIWLTYRLSCVISYVKVHAPALFARLKAER